MNAIRSAAIALALVSGAAVGMHFAQADTQPDYTPSPPAQPGPYKLDVFIRSGAGEIIKAYHYLRPPEFASKDECEDFVINDKQFADDEIQLAAQFKPLLTLDPKMTMQAVCMPVGTGD